MQSAHAGTVPEYVVVVENLLEPLVSFTTW